MKNTDTLASEPMAAIDAGGGYPAALQAISSKTELAAKMCSSPGPAEGFRMLHAIAERALRAGQVAAQPSEGSLQAAYHAMEAAQKPIPPDIAKSLSDGFWDLMGDNAATPSPVAPVQAAQADEPIRTCGLCGEAQAFTGTCGGGRGNPKALCFEGAALSAPPIEPKP